MNFPYSFWDKKKTSVSTAIVNPAGGYVTFPKSTTERDDAVIAGTYPSTITVAGYDGVISGVVLHINGFTHTAPVDARIVLESPGGQLLRVMNYAGDGTDATALDLIFDDVLGAGLIPQDTALLAGTYKVSNYPNYYGSLFDPMFSPCPSENISHLADFKNFSPNGTWKLWCAGYNNGSHGGNITSWSLDITTTTTPSSHITTAPYIVINDNAVATPSPSKVFVTYQNGLITNTYLHLYDLSHAHAQDIAITLYYPGLAYPSTIISNAGPPGDAFSLTNADFDVRDGAAAPFPYTSFAAGSYQPVNSFYNSWYSRDPNGTWLLYVTDTNYYDAGSIVNWTLTFDIV